MRESVRLRVSVIPIVILTLTLTLKHNIRTLSVIFEGGTLFPSGEQQL